MRSKICRRTTLLLALLPVLWVGCKPSRAPQLRVDPTIRFELLTPSKATPGFSLDETKLALAPYTGGEALRLYLKGDAVRRYHVRMAHRLSMKRSGVTELKTRLLQDMQLQVRTRRYENGKALQRMRISGARLLAEPSQGELGKKVEDMLNEATLTYTIDRRGAVHDLKSGPSVSRELTQFMATFRQVVLQAMPTFPAGKVDGSGRWSDKQEHKIQLPSGASLRVITERTFRVLGERKCASNEAKNSCLLLSQRFKVTIDGAIQQLGVSAPVRGAGTGVAAILFDRDRGTFRRVELASHVTNRLTLTSGSTSRPVEQNVDLRYTLVETR
ncbi:MAG: hypothetical protein KC609_01935 [Myxococcales bacterium]|nr:hypothetical protein [Myxococcales bacterium]